MLPSPCLWGTLGASWEGLQEDQKGVQFLVWFWVRFGAQNGFQNCSKIGPKLVQKLSKIMLFFGIHFLELLELFRCLLGAFWGFLRPSWEASGLQKPWKTEGFLRFLERHLFAALELLMALRGPSWRARGRSGTQKGPHK